MKLAIVLASLFVTALFPLSQASAECEIGEPVTTPITFAGSDRIPVISGTVNQQPFRFKLHSSDSASTLNRAPVEKLGLAVGQRSTNYDGIDILTTFTDKVTAGAVSRRGEFVVTDNKSTLYDGVLGGTMLFRLDVELAFANGYIKQTKPSGCFRTFLATWDPQATVVRFTNDASHGDLRPWFWVSINGTPLHATIATEEPYTMVDAKTAARLGLTAEMPGARAAGEVTGWRDKVQKVSTVPADVAIGNYHDKAATVRIFDMDLSGEMMVLGADFLRANRILVSTSQQKLYITPLKERMFAE